MFREVLLACVLGVCGCEVATPTPVREVPSCIVRCAYRAWKIPEGWDIDAGLVEWRPFCEIDPSVECTMQDNLRIDAHCGDWDCIEERMIE